MNTPLLIACLLLTTPVAAQTRVYSNADLGKPLAWSHTPTPEELASLKARQFVAPPLLPDRPSVRVIDGDPTHGPFGPFELSALTEPLDPNWRNDAWGYWGPGLVSSFPVGKRGFGFGGGYRDGGRRSRSITSPSGAGQRPAHGFTPPPAAPSPPAPAGSMRLAGNAAAVPRSVPR